MEVKIKFAASIYIKGDDLSEIKQKWMTMPLFSADALEDGFAEYDETLLVEDSETYEDLMSEFDKA